MCRGDASNANPGNNLYITGLSTRVTEEQLRDHFLKEGKVRDSASTLEAAHRVLASK